MKQESTTDGTFNRLYLDKAGVTHLIIAAENSEAGEYFNPGAINFLLSKLEILERKENLNLYERFAAFCQEELSKHTGAKLGLRYDAQQSKILAEGEQSCQELSNVWYEGSCNVFDRTFEPEYSVKYDFQERDFVLCIVEVELVDLIESTFSYKIMESRGWLYLRIKGQKKSVCAGEGIEDKGEDKIALIKSTRREGQFDCSIRLVESMSEESCLIDSSIAGIKRFKIKCIKQGSLIIS